MHAYFSRQNKGNLIRENLSMAKKEKLLERNRISSNWGTKEWHKDKLY